MSFEKPLRASLLVLFAASLSACLPWPRERAAYADLCKTDYQFEVEGPQGKNSIILKTYLYDYPSRWSDQPFNQGLHVNYPGQEYSTPEFYVQLIAYNKGRQRVARPQSGAAPVPILYDSRQAYITFEDGSRLNARPDIYLSGDKAIYDFPRVNEDFARPSPYNINSDEVHRSIPKITNNKSYGSAYVVFKTADFNADSKWTIHLGTLEVEGQAVQIPPLNLCNHPVKKWIGIEPLMRP